ncbi:DNA-directed RNA polymerase III subunit 2 [Bienertia sinuspersici]
MGIHFFSEYRPSPLKHSGLGGDNVVIDQAALFSNKNSSLCINFMIRQTRRPEVTCGYAYVVITIVTGIYLLTHYLLQVGDMFSSRHGQKGVCGTIMQQEDFIFSKRGNFPTLIMNPHEFARYFIKLLSVEF